MAAGIPGTGIGGIFYLLLAFIMPVHELWLLVRGRSSLKRWRLIAIQLANASGVLVSLAGMSWLARKVAQPLIRVAATTTHRDIQLRQMQSATTVSFAWLTVAALGLATIGVLVLRAILPVMVRLRSKSLVR